MAGIWAQQGLTVLLRTAGSTLTSGRGYSSVTEKDSDCLTCARFWVQVPGGKKTKKQSNLLSLLRSGAYTVEPASSLPFIHVRHFLCDPFCEMSTA